MNKNKNANNTQEYSSEEDDLYDLASDLVYDDVNVFEQLMGLEAGASCTESGANPGVNPSEDEDRSRCQYNLAEKRGFIEVKYPDGTIANVKKSTFVWKLLENNGKLSSDRLKRVQGSETEPKRKK